MQLRAFRNQVVLWLQLSLAAIALAQTVPATPPPSAQPPTAETRITQQQAKELFRSVDDIMRFASQDSKLVIHHEVKRRLTTRDDVEKFLELKFSEDESAKRLQRSEIVLKKFGLLDRDFQLGPFLLSLLREQIAGFYDNKTKTINLLDYLPPDAQKPVLAHELTHALQDQHIDLTKWQNQSANTIAKNVKEDNQHIERDEDDTARDAVLEGQAMVVFFDYALRASGKTLQQMPESLPKIEESMGDSSDSPILARAPLILKESLIFPYREGVGFVGTILARSGPAAAFAGTLDRPPSSSFEILHPDAYLEHVKVPVLRLPDLHPLLDADYNAYDVGVMGEVDVRMLAELFAGPEVAKQLSNSWRGGIYYAAQRKSAITPAATASTASLGLAYLSRWGTSAAANKFAKIYAAQFARKYQHATRDIVAATGDAEQIYNTEEGPAIVLVAGKSVLTLEGFELPLARRLELSMLATEPDSGSRVAAAAPPELTGDLRALFLHPGVMRSALTH
jgi:hypothetical protein